MVMICLVSSEVLENRDFSGIIRFIFDLFFLSRKEYGLESIGEIII